MNIQKNNKNYVNSISKRFIKGNKIGAINELTNYLKNNSNDILAHYNLGYMYQEINKLDIAIEQYEIVLKKDKKNWQSLSNLGLIYFFKKEYQKSINYHLKVLEEKKDYQPSLRDIGTNYLLLNKYKLSENYLEKSLKLNPKDYINLNSLGLTKMRLEKTDSAKLLYEKAIELNNKYYPSYNNLGLYYDRFGEKEKAFEFYKKALKLEPNYPNSLNNIGLIYFYYEENKKAFECFNKALKLDPGMIDLYFNLGHTYFKLRNFEKAEKWFQKGFKLDSLNINGHYNYSFMLLALSKYNEAWKEYEYRLRRSARINENFLYEDIKDKLWNFQKLENKNILIVREQGAGDEILYSSMYSDLIKLNSNIKIESDPRLIKLFNNSFDSNSFIPSNKISQNKNSLKKIDIILFAGSLGNIFRKNIKSFPKRKKFLVPNKSLCKKVKSKLDNIDKKIKIGISWISKNKRIGGGKSMSLNTLLPILKIKNVSYVNLQYGNYSNDIKKFTNKTGIEIIDLHEIDKFNDFNNLAALIDSLDLFITVSNTTAHLSAALGKETWVMAPKNDSLLFYWNTGKEKTPWYPSVKIFQKTSSWESTVEKVYSDLKKRIKKFKN